MQCMQGAKICDWLHIILSRTTAILNALGTAMLDEHTVLCLEQINGLRDPIRRRCNVVKVSAE